MRNSFNLTEKKFTILKHLRSRSKGCICPDCDKALKEVRVFFTQTELQIISKELQLDLK